MEGSRKKAVTLTALAYETISKGKHHLYTEVEEMMETKLARISQLSKQNPDMVLTSVGHLIKGYKVPDARNTRCQERKTADKENKYQMKVR